MSNDHLDPFANNDENLEPKKMRKTADPEAEAASVPAADPEMQSCSSALKEQNAQLKDQMRRIQADAINLENVKQSGRCWQMLSALYLKICSMY